MIFRQKVSLVLLPELRVRHEVDEVAEVLDHSEDTHVLRRTMLTTTYRNDIDSIRRSQPEGR